MESAAFYWEYFLQQEQLHIRSFWQILRHLSLSNGWVLGYSGLGVLFVLELVHPWRKLQPKLRPGLGTDLFYLLVNVLVLFFFSYALINTLMLAFTHALYHFFGITNIVAIKLDGMQMWARYVLMLVVGDLLGYFGHILLHRVGFLWRFHAIHHSSRMLDVWNAQRFHIGEQLFYPILLMVPMAMIGFPTGELVIASVLFRALSTFTHANVKVPLGPLKYVLNNPQFHLWHHAASVDPRRNVNYGDSLSCWDYLFGTAYMPEERSDLKLGFEGVEAFPTRFMAQQIHPLKTLLLDLRKRWGPLLARS